MYSPLQKIISSGGRYTYKDSHTKSSGLDLGRIAQLSEEDAYQREIKKPGVKLYLIICNLRDTRQHALQT
jgi:hypothetical protein